MIQVLMQTLFCTLQVNKTVDQKLIHIIAYQVVAQLLT